MTQPPSSPPPNQTGYSSAPGQRNSGLGIAALVIGIIACLLALTLCLSWLGAILGVIGVILGAIGWVQASKDASIARGMPMTGTILSGVAILLAVVVTVGAMAFARTVGEGMERWAADLEQRAEEWARQVEQAGTRHEVAATAEQARQEMVSEARAAGVSDSTIRQAENNFRNNMAGITDADTDLEAARQQAEDALEQLRRDLEADRQ